jgi:hypothetical protein
MNIEQRLAALSPELREAIEREAKVDNRPVRQPHPPIKPVPETPRGTGWQKDYPLEPPPGIALIDAMCAQQDRRDRAERIEAALKEAAAHKLDEAIQKQAK